MSNIDKASYLWTGQQTCHNAEGQEINCSGTGQDAEFSYGIPWPAPRFEIHFEINGALVEDRLTGLMWTRIANCRTSTQLAASAGFCSANECS